MTKMRSLYRSLGLFSTKGQAAVCADFKGRASVLAKCFAEAVNEIGELGDIDQPFLPEMADDQRQPITEKDRNDNAIYCRLKNRQSVIVSVPHGEYRFKVHCRQVPPLRRQGAGAPESGRGGIDYVGIAGNSPVLGEIKCEGDQNPFYAFIQLLTYLSEMATVRQIKRAREHLFANDEIAEMPAFDLHILLADFNDRGDKAPLIGATQSLVDEFRCALGTNYSQIASVLGDVLCLKLDTEEFDFSPDQGIQLCWISKKGECTSSYSS